MTPTLNGVWTARKESRGRGKFDDMLLSRKHGTKRSTVYFRGYSELQETPMYSAVCPSTLRVSSKLWTRDDTSTPKRREKGSDTVKRQA